MDWRSKLNDPLDRTKMSPEEREKKITKNRVFARETPYIAGHRVNPGGQSRLAIYHPSYDKKEVTVYTDYFFKNKSKRRRSRVTKSKSRRRSRIAKSKSRRRSRVAKSKSRSRPETKYQKFVKSESKKAIYKDLTYREKIKIISAIWQIKKNKVTLKKRICNYLC